MGPLLRQWNECYGRRSNQSVAILKAQFQLEGGAVPALSPPKGFYRSQKSMLNETLWENVPLHQFFPLHNNMCVACHVAAIARKFSPSPSFRRSAKGSTFMQFHFTLWSKWTLSAILNADPEADANSSCAPKSTKHCRVWPGNVVSLFAFSGGHI